MRGHLYTDEQDAWLKQHRQMPRKALTQAFNARFDTAISQDAICGLMLRRGWLTGRSGSFEKGSIPHNKGRRTGYCYSPETTFKPGDMPKNFRPVGAERISKDGYIEIKVANPKSWRSKHAHLYEQAYGKIPKGHIIIFLDGDNRNFGLDNLYMISRAANAYLTIQKLHELPPDLRVIACNMAELQAKTKKISICKTATRVTK